jgi:alkanesulfonate monooxygenase SsuD/methylene tetrahydromethanopterin reductase-like flavin-dependent oxidoreductase (luciferase family)
MMSSFPRSPEIRAANPVLNSNRLKLGVFASNWPGMTLTNMPGGRGFVPTWEASLEITRLAEEAGLEALVPASRWKSHHPNKHDHFSSQCLENFTWASATALATRRIAVFATVHMAVYPPVLAAKQAATIDQICGGRFGINLVAGWNARELGMFGTKLLLNHDERYGQAAEWMEIVRRVWESEEEFDFHGQFYDIEGAYTEPKPAQEPGPIVMNAGASGQGRAFSAKYADMAFVSITRDDPASAAETVQVYRDFARERFGREVGVWTLAHIVQGDSDENANALADEMYAHGDFELVELYVQQFEATNSTAGMPEEVSRRLVLGNGSFPLIGSAETIADRLEMLSEAGLDGLVFCWFDYAAGLRRFAAEVLPLLEKRGLRAPNLDAEASGSIDAARVVT